MSFISKSAPVETDLPDTQARGNLTRAQVIRIGNLLAWLTEIKSVKPKASEAWLCRAAGVPQDLWSAIKGGNYTQPAEIDEHLATMERARAQVIRIDDLLAWLTEIKSVEPRASEAWLCRAAGMTQPLWSAIKGGTYTQPAQIDKHLVTMERARSTLQTSLKGTPGPALNAVSAPASDDHFETQTIRDVMDAVDASLKLAAKGSEHKLTILSAPSRHGKTFISQLLVQRFSGVALNALTDWKTSRRAMLEDVAKRLGLTVKKSARSYEISRQIREAFKTPKLLIFTELGKHTVGPAFIVWIRELLNESRAVVILCAVPELLEELASAMKDELEQVENRGRLIRSHPIGPDAVQWFFARSRHGNIPTEAAQALATGANQYGGFTLLRSAAALKTPPADAEAASEIVRSYRHTRHIEPRRAQRGHRIG